MSKTDELTLFLDTSYKTRVAIYSKRKVYQFSEFLDQKSSDNLHGQIYAVLEEQGLSFQQIKSCMIINGPGFYTGLRVAEGFAQILELNGAKVFSTHHYLLPKLLGEKAYHWISDGFKGETFIFTKNTEKEEFKLIKTAEFEFSKLSEKKLWTDSELSFKNLPMPPLIEFSENLLKTKLLDLGSILVEQNSRQEVFYFRPIESEFKKSK